jgi:hypothetical protein
VIPRGGDPSAAATVIAPGEFAAVVALGGLEARRWSRSAPGQDHGAAAVIARALEPRRSPSAAGQDHGAAVIARGDLAPR